jgi:hypothetical protein
MPLRPLIIDKGIIQPSFGKRKHCSLFRRNLIPAGVLTSSGIPIRQSSVVIYEREVVRPVRINLSKTEIKYINEDAIYFCIQQGHFGHILTGTMAFAYILLNKYYANHKIVFIDKEPSELIIILLKYLGVDRKNIITITQYTQFKRVVVVKPSLRITWLRRFGKRWFKVNGELIDTFQAIAKNVNKTFHSSLGRYEKVYFSRSKFGGRITMYEDKIENVFKKNGYEIFYPEQLPLEEQIKLVSNADFYACVQGTLEHHSLFMKDGAALIVMSRKSKPTERQVLINKLQKSIKHIYLRADIQPFGDKVTPNIIGATKDFIKFFDEYKFSYNAEDLILTEREINDYITGCYFRNMKQMPIVKFWLNALIKRILVSYQSSLQKQMR